MGEDATLQEGVELCFDKLGQPRPGLAFDLGQEGFEVLLDQLVEGGVFGTSPLIVDAPYSRRQLSRFGHRP